MTKYKLVATVEYTDGNPYVETEEQRQDIVASHLQFVSENARGSGGVCVEMMDMSIVSDDKGKKKCPFCGSVNLQVEECYNLFHVQCYNCGCTGPLFLPFEDDCIRAWNTRVCGCEKKEMGE